MPSAVGRGSGVSVRTEGSVEALRELPDAEAVERRVTQDTTRRDELLVQALAIRSDEDEAAVRSENLVLNGRVGDADARDPSERALVAAPDLGAQQPGGHRDQGVVQVGEHDGGHYRKILRKTILPSPAAPSSPVIPSATRPAVKASG